MTRRFDPFSTALRSLRERAEEGVYAPGRPVVIIEEAQRLRLSTTPIREALGWLCGYGLIERAPQGGFVAPRLDVGVVRDRLAFRLQCLAVSLNGLGQPSAQGDVGVAEASRSGLASRMLRAVRGTGNSALVEAYVRVDSQLLQLAGAERRLFRDLDEETDALLDLFDRPPGSGLKEAVARYHRRRIEAAPLLVMEAEASREPHGPGG